MNDKEYNQFCNYLSERAELKVQEMIEAGMRGRPGLLIRSFKSEENLYKELSKLLGISIVPNCSKDHTKHTKECYRMETDFILLYPDKDKLAIRLIEVKRPNSVPWAKHVKKPLNPRLVASAQEQLVRALNFSLAFLPDVPTVNLDIKPVMAFPESLCSAEFCQDCSDLIITMEDIQKGPEQVLKKLSMGSESVTDDSKALFLQACARLIGKESLLHTGYRTLADKFSRSKEAKTSHIARVEKSLIMLSPAQREVFRTVKTNEQLKYYCFVGGSGTGKTHLSLRTVDNLIQRYEARDPGQNIQVYLTYKDKKSEKNFALQEIFQNFGKKRGEFIKTHISKFEELGELDSIKYPIKLLLHYYFKSPVM